MLWERLTRLESGFWAEGKMVAGVDEAGRGPLAGPVVAAAVILHPDRPVYGVNDSKVLTDRRRRELFVRIVESAVAVGVGMVGPRTIERINILEATRLAMRRALGGLGRVPDVLLSDAVALGGPWHELALVRGDSLSASIGAASIVAKVVRDRYMEELAGQFPDYGFDRHKGYPTRGHRELLARLGATPAHRATFLGVRRK